MKLGRPIDDRRREYGAMLGLTHRQRRDTTHSFMDRLDRCKDNSTRRVVRGANIGPRGKRRSEAPDISPFEWTVREVRTENYREFWHMAFDAPEPHQKQGFWWYVERIESSGPVHGLPPSRDTQPEVCSI